MVRAGLLAELRSLSPQDMRSLSQWLREWAEEKERTQPDGAEVGPTFRELVLQNVEALEERFLEGLYYTTETDLRIQREEACRNGQ